MAFRLDPKKSALIIQDLQNDVIMPGGAFTASDGPGPAEHAKSQKVVANVKSIAAAARAAGMPVIHVWYVVEKGAPGLKRNAPLFEAVAAGAVVRGSWGAAPVSGLEPKKGDLVVEKMRMNAFHDTNLETLLKGLGAETVVITGAWTNFSIEHTARHAADAGYRAVVVTDGTSTIDDEWQNAALNYALQNIAERVPAKDVVAALKRRSKRA
jgi:gluconolactonase